MNNETLTLDELIRELNEIRDNRGGNTLIYKRRIKISDGTTQLMPITRLNIDHKNGAYCITL